MQQELPLCCAVDTKLRTPCRHKEEEWMAARLARQRQNGRGSLVPEQPWGMTGLPHKSKGDPREHAHPTPFAHLHAVAAQVGMGVYYILLRILRLAAHGGLQCSLIV